MMKKTLRLLLLFALTITLWPFILLGLAWGLVTASFRVGRASADVAVRQALS